MKNVAMARSSRNHLLKVPPCSSCWAGLGVPLSLETPTKSPASQDNSRFRSGQEKRAFGLALQLKLWFIELLCAKF